MLMRLIVCVIMIFAVAVDVIIVRCYSVGLHDEMSTGRRGGECSESGKTVLVVY